jgi:hypothetical protein
MSRVAARKRSPQQQRNWNTTEVPLVAKTTRVRARRQDLMNSSPISPAANDAALPRLNSRVKDGAKLTLVGYQRL